MKNKKKLIAVAVIIIIAGTIFQYFQYLNEKAFNLYVQKYPNQLLESETAINDLAQIIGSKDVNVVIRFYETELGDLLSSPTAPEVHAGITNAFQIFKADVKSKDFDVLYSVSPDPFSECFFETKVVTLKGSPIKTIAQLNNKKVALHSPSEKVAFMLYPQFKQDKVIFNQAIINQSREWIHESLLNKKIDAAISFQPILSGKDRSRENFIQSFNKSEINNHIKLIALTDYKIPCKVFFVNKKLDTALKEKFIENFTAAIENSTNFPYFKDIAQAGSITEIDPQAFKKVEQAISEMS